MAWIVCHYGLHFSEITKKFQETIDVPATRLRDLAEFLEKKYVGFAKELIHPETGGLLTRNAILIQRGEENTTVLSSLDSELRDGDILTFF